MYSPPSLVGSAGQPTFLFPSLLFLFPSLCIGGSGRRRIGIAPCAPPPPPPPSCCSPRRLLPPSCSPRRPLPHSGDAELRKIPGAALPPSPAVRAATLASVPAPSRAQQAEARLPLIHGATMPSGPAQFLLRQATEASPSRPPSTCTVQEQVNNLWMRHAWVLRWVDFFSR